MLSTGPGRPSDFDLAGSLVAVQFHPESILTLGEDLGLRLIRNVVACLG